MVSKKTFQSEFGRQIWKEFFSFLEEPPEEPLKLSAYTAPAQDSREAEHVQGSSPLQEEQTTTSRNPSGQKSLDDFVKSFGEPEEPVEPTHLETKPEVTAASPGDCSGDRLRAGDLDYLFSDVNTRPELPKGFSSKQSGSLLPIRSGKSPTLYDIIRFYRNEGVVGEESLAVAITLAAANSSSFGVEGFSGSGKTFVVDMLISLLPEEWVYRIELSSKMAIFSDAERINGSKFIYIPELQKAMQDKRSPIIEVIKNLTEGKDANRIVTRRGKEGGTLKYSIKKGISIIYTLALENYFKKDEESSRRFMMLQTDSSQEHLDEIHTYKARRRFSISPDRRRAERLKAQLRQHISDVSSMDNVRVLDPCAEYFKELIPKTQKSVGYVDHYYSLVDACAKFHYADRETFEVDGITYIIANVEDHYNVFNIYFRDFTHTLEGFAERMKDGEEKEKALAELVEVRDPNWAECLRMAQNVLLKDTSLEDVREAFPNLADSWYTRQHDNCVISTLDYKTGKPIEIDNLSKLAQEDIEETPLDGEAQE